MTLVSLALGGCFTTGNVFEPAPIEDLGVAEHDAGRPDSGDVSRACLEINPRPLLTFPASGEAALQISNRCGLPVLITQLAIFGTDNSLVHPSVDDFRVARCSLEPCVPVLLCTEADCAAEVNTVTLVYENNDQSEADLAELRIVSRSDVVRSNRVQLEAQGAACEAPVAMISAMPEGRFCAGQRIVLDGSASTSGSVQIFSYLWSWSETPGAQPELEQLARSEFTPESVGRYVVNLGVTNDCGRMSETAVERMDVEDCG